MTLSPQISKISSKGLRSAEEKTDEWETKLYKKMPFWVRWWYFCPKKIDIEKLMSRIVQQKDFNQNGQLGKKWEQFEVSDKNHLFGPKHQK
jgi:hypothetical protein